MPEKEVQKRVREYFENVPEAEQREFADAVLESRKRARPPAARDVPPRVLLISRALCLLLLAASVLSAGVSMYIAADLVVLAMASFPNHMGVVAARLVSYQPLRRAFDPWSVFIVAWGFILIALVLFPVLGWLGSH